MYLETNCTMSDSEAEYYDEFDVDVDDFVESEIDRFYSYTPPPPRHVPLDDETREEITRIFTKNTPLYKDVVSVVLSFL